uniref:Uncharacterized protein n=7 Tax=Vibrionaceae TaxID=641 RepID=A0A0H3ZVG0_9VIBR|nr:hypothetical protein [Vibrio splendidus]AKN37844.1 hypothetical protein [Vibrio tasmaniensis]AKN38752.1 hypothetical protein [Enterovibrio norvegicus]AKN38948.1 hypothetical protein [Aliivibrio fischeri]AKN39141.1 hypothetical protein [Vibrio kanaloae]AKN39941.1 hypothetical protein [Vibrio sp. FF_307]
MPVEIETRPGEYNEDIVDIVTADSDIESLMSFAIDQRAIIEAETSQIQYPEYQYDQILPVDYGQDPWADKVVRRIKDVRGTLKWGSPNNNDIPRVGVAYTMKEYDVYKREIGISYTNEDLIRAARTGINLSSDQDEACREITEQDKNTIALFGNVNKGMEGFFTSSLIPRMTATSNVKSICEAVTLTGGIQQAINFFWTPMQQVSLNQTKTIYRAQGIALSERDYGYLRSTHIPASGDTLLNFLQQKLNILFVPFWYLDHNNLPTVDDSDIEFIGLSNDIMMVFRYDPKCARFHLPMPFEFGPTYFERGGAVIKQDGKYRTGGTEIRIPQAFLYVDLPDTDVTKALTEDAAARKSLAITKSGKNYVQGAPVMFKDYDNKQPAVQMQRALGIEQEKKDGADQTDS